MPKTAEFHDDTLDKFDRRYSPSGLLERYAIGRSKRFSIRVFFYCVLSIAILPVVPWFVVLAALFVLIAGECVDNLVLRQVPGWLDKGKSFSRVSRATFVSGLCHAVAVAIYTLANGSWIGTVASPMFCIAFLTAACVDICGYLVYNPRVVIARLIIFCLAALALILFNQFDSSAYEISFDMGGVALLGLMIFIYSDGISRAHRSFVDKSRTALAAKVATNLLNHDLMQQEAELHRLSLVARHARDSVIVAGADKRILWVNDAFVKQTGFEKEEVMGERSSELLCGPETDSETLELIRAEVRAGSASRAQLLHYSKDKSKIWVDLQIIPVFAKNGELELYISVERDVTQAREREVELAQAKVAAEDSERVKAAFLATMSHEIRTPMNGIIGMAELLGGSGLDGEQQIYLNTIRDSADALLKIINDILDLSKLDADKLSIDPENFSLRDCVLSVGNLLRLQAQEKGLTLDVDMHGPIPQMLSGDDGRIRQIILNLVGNALKFTEKGGVVVTLKCEDHGPNYCVTISVKDSGIGIAQSRLENIFEEFEQADAATTRRFGGTGLGLTISRLLARRMGGDITASSVAGEGSVFQVTMILEPADNTRVTAQANNECAEVLLDGQIILVAEDNGTNRLLIKKFLQDLPIEVHFALNGVEAVEKVKTYAPDLVFMDMSMPEMDGIEATQLIRSLPIPQPHIVALTANAFASDRLTCIAAGMDDFLAKPVRRAELIAAIGGVPNKPRLRA